MKPKRFIAETHMVTWWMAFKAWTRTGKWERWVTRYYEISPNDPRYETAPYELGITYVS